MLRSPLVTRACSALGHEEEVGDRAGEEKAKGKRKIGGRKGKEGRRGGGGGRGRDAGNVAAGRRGRGGSCGGGGSRRHSREGKAEEEEAEGTGPPASPACSELGEYLGPSLAEGSLGINTSG